MDRNDRMKGVVCFFCESLFFSRLCYIILHRYTRRNAFSFDKSKIYEGVSHLPKCRGTRSSTRDVMLLTQIHFLHNSESRITKPFLNIQLEDSHFSETKIYDDFFYRPPQLTVPGPRPRFKEYIRF